MSDELQVVYSAQTVQVAHILRNILEQCGIEAYVSNESGNELHGGQWNWPVVLVRTKDTEAATLLMQDFEARQQERLAEGFQEPEAPETVAVIPLWPRCPHCRRPRLTSCPVCQSPGGELPWADAAPGEEMHDGDVICPTCDEPFHPVFPLHCEWCNYEFAHGHRAEEEDFTRPFEPPNPRVTMLVVGMVVLGMVMMGYFLWIART